jgi:hypothetical protein
MNERAILYTYFICLLLAIDEDHNFMSVYTTKNIGWLVLFAYTLVQMINFWLIVDGACKGYKLGHIANLVSGHEDNDLL